jgi:hypothetical protein
MVAGYVAAHYGDIDGFPGDTDRQLTDTYAS